MGPAPRQIGGLPVVCFSPISGRHRLTGHCRHVSPGGLLGPVKGVAICGRSGESVYLHGCDENWRPITDTWHETVEEAMRQAELEYEGVSQTWQRHT